MNYHYRLIEGSYFLYDGDTLLTGQDEVAICFSHDGDLYTLHKHGDPKWVNKWAEDTKKKYLDNGLADLAGELTVISGKFPIEELNKMLDITGYIGTFLKKFNLLPGPSSSSGEESSDPPPVEEPA